MSPELFVHTFNCLEEAGQTAAQPDGDIGSMMTVRDEGRTEPLLIPSLYMLRLGRIEDSTSPSALSLAGAGFSVHVCFYLHVQRKCVCG